MTASSIISAGACSHPPSPGGPIDGATSDGAPGTSDGAIADAPTTSSPDAKVDGGDPTHIDVTFYVVADTHADPVEEVDLKAMARAIDAVAANGSWPASIDGHATGFPSGAIGPPRGVVFVGDLTGWGTAPTEIPMFKHYFQKGTSGDSIHYPAYVGLGNHDVDDADRPADVAAAYRAMYWSFVDERHRGAGAPVPVAHFDDTSHSYSWDWGGVHLVQTHRFPGDAGHGLAHSLAFLKDDLAHNAADGRPVFVFHHYAMDAFGSEARWWTDDDRAAYRDAIATYDIAGIIAGHSHFAMQYDWEGHHVFQVNNAKAEINAGNNDGNGAFAIVHIDDTRVDIVTCRWTDADGHYELIAPYYSAPYR